ncbi:sulfotransferase [Dyella sp. ASV21]|uniref:tetratricopeptide repeat-containing sulfotransferase family protein n=1 Tax=Dyella sp. ASV21 TaxID=2795114 RepID=UPI0018EB7C52|nr:sulfotransferase [Dyella sp. ASV21]
MTAPSVSNDPAVSSATVQACLSEIQALALRKNWNAALLAATHSLELYPGADDIRLAYAGLLLELGRNSPAEEALRHILARNPHHAGAAFQLARWLRSQGRMQAMAKVLGDAFGTREADLNWVIRAAEELDAVGQQAAAAALCETQIAAGTLDPRIHALAGTYAAQLGAYERARERHEFALAHSPQALEWHSPLSLAELQRYASDQHQDFARLHALRERGDLSAHARSGVLFALGKAHDDIGAYVPATDYLREANALAGADSAWSRKQWRRSVDARLKRQAPRATNSATARDWTPIFIVGAPRSGTTLLAERLSRHPEVTQRGELPQLPQLSAQLADTPMSAEQLDQAARLYAAQLRQDDGEARWYIDKQPFNFLHVDIALAMFPHARFLFCQRGMRDNALSIWMQSFQRGAQDYAYDMGDIAAVLQGARRLQAHWLARYPASVRVVSYEELAQEPARVLEELAAWLQLPPCDLLAARSDGQSISTASLWQARQAIHTRSVQRWRHYAASLPELMAISEY